MNLSDAAGNITTKDEEEAEVLNAFITSAFNSFPKDTQPELEERDEEQNKPPTIQRKQRLATPPGLSQVRESK